MRQRLVVFFCATGAIFCYQLSAFGPPTDEVQSLAVGGLARGLAWFLLGPPPRVTTLRGRVARLERRLDDQAQRHQGELAEALGARLEATGFDALGANRLNHRVPAPTAPAIAWEGCQVPIEIWFP